MQFFWAIRCIVNCKVTEIPTKVVIMLMFGGNNDKLGHILIISCTCWDNDEDRRRLNNNEVPL